jgi:hypothetical protein
VSSYASADVAAAGPFNPDPCRPRSVVAPGNVANKLNGLLSDVRAPNYAVPSDLWPLAPFPETGADETAAGYSLTGVRSKLAVDCI